MIRRRRHARGGRAMVDCGDRCQRAIFRYDLCLRVTSARVYKASQSGESHRKLAMPLRKPFFMPVSLRFTRRSLLR